MKVGITGHQDLSAYNIQWIKGTINNWIRRNPVEKGSSSLAIGADQLFVQCLLENEKKYDVVIPCKGYEQTFKTLGDRNNYYLLLNRASEVIALDFEGPSELAFYEAGITIVDFSDIILAVWDGKKAKGLGGTGDIVEIALRKIKTVIHIDPLRLQVNNL